MRLQIEACILYHSLKFVIFPYRSKFAAFRFTTLILKAPRTIIYHLSCGFGVCWRFLIRILCLDYQIFIISCPGESVYKVLVFYIKFTRAKIPKVFVGAVGDSGGSWLRFEALIMTSISLWKPFIEFWLPILSLEASTTLISNLSWLRLWRLLEVHDWGFEFLSLHQYL